MKDTCSVCTSFERPMSAPKENDTTVFCSDDCEKLFRAWADSGSAQSLFSFYLRKKYPQEVSP